MIAETRHSNAILFFDEADALFGKRTEISDARDRCAKSGDELPLAADGSL
jgi:ATP-dependent 26S proteasome regulatory subunit